MEELKSADYFKDLSRLAIEKKTKYNDELTYDIVLESLMTRIEKAAKNGESMLVLKKKGSLTSIRMEVFNEFQEFKIEITQILEDKKFRVVETNCRQPCINSPEETIEYIICWDY